MKTTFFIFKYSRTMVVLKAFRNQRHCLLLVFIQRDLEHAALVQNNSSYMLQWDVGLPSRQLLAAPCFYLNKQNLSEIRRSNGKSQDNEEKSYRYMFLLQTN